MDQSDMNVDSNSQQASNAASPSRGSTVASRSDDESLHASKKRQVQRLLAELETPTASKRARRTLPTVSTPQAKTIVSINPMVTLSSIRAVNTIQYDKVKTDRKHSTLTSSMMDAINLPPQVPNIFSSSNPHTPCQCTAHQCSRGCISAEYLEEYGWEYRALLKESEGRSYQDPCIEAKDADPQKLLTLSGISPLPANRTREQTQWASPRSINWDLDDYMERQPDLAPRMRAILIDWVVELSEEYKLSDKSFHLAVTLIDLSLASFKDGIESDIFAVSRDMLQCLGCACTLIASKMEEVVARSVDDFVYISDNIYRREQIIDMEMQVCMALKFRLQHVTPAHFVHEFLLASEGVVGNHTLPTACAFHPVLRHMVNYLLELSRLSYRLVSVKPSLVAAAAVYLARATLGIREMAQFKATDSQGFWTKTLQHYTGYSVEDMKDTVRVLLAEHRDAETSSLKSVFNKYSKAKCMHVSTKTVLDHEYLNLDVLSSTCEQLES